MNAQERAERAAELRRGRGVADPTLQNIQQPIENRSGATIGRTPTDEAIETGDVSSIIAQGMNDPRTQERLRTGGAPGFLSPDQGKRFSEAESFAYGLLDTITGGNAAAYQAGGEGPLAYAPSLLRTPVGVGNSLINMVTGSPAIAPSEETEQRVDQALTENRGSSIAGQVAGAVGPGALAAKGAQYALTKLPKSIAWLGETLMGRALAASATGAGEGVLYARSKGENQLGGAAAGIIGGGGGSAALDLLGKGFNALFGAASKTSARQLVGDQMTYTNEGAGLRTNEILTQGQELGPRATLMDVDQGAMIRGETNLVSANRNRESQSMSNIMEERLGNPRVTGAGQGQVYEEFAASMRDMLPQGFDPLSGHVDTARAADTALRHSREYYKAISDEFGSAINNSTLSVNPTSFRQSLQRASRGPGIPKPPRGGKAPANKGIRTAWERVQKELEAQTTYKKVPKKGGARGEKTPVAQPHTAHQLHNLRVFIDDIIDTSMAPGGTAIDRSEMAALSRMRTAISDRLNSDTAIADVNRKYATQASYMRAYDLGSSVLSKGKNAKSSEEIENWMVTANSGDINGFIEGVSRVLADKVRSVRGEPQTTRMIAMDEEIADRLRTVFPNDADKIIQEANTALRLMDTAGTMVRGSQTGRRKMMQQSENKSGNIFDIAVISGAIYNVLHSGGGMSKAAGAGALRRLLPTMTDPDETAEMARLLTMPGVEGMQSALDDIEQAMASGPNTSLLSFPRTMFGPDAALDAQAGKRPTTAGTQDIGQTLPLSLGVSAPAAALNTPHRAQQREDQRAREAYYNRLAAERRAMRR